MIELLQRLARNRAEAVGMISPRAAQLLEWSRVTGQIATHCRNLSAARAVNSHQPYFSQEAIALEHALADEVRASGQAGQWPPLMDLGPGLELLVRSAPVRHEGPDLVHLATVAEELDAFRDYFLARRAPCPLWGEAAVQMAVFSGLSGAIRRALDPDGRIVDGASPLLARLRRTVSGQERSVRQEMNSVMTQARSQGWTTGTEVTLRGDRFCLPLRSGQSTRVPGIVHDRSATGATLFVEPASVVRLSNELVETRLAITAEEARILFELNRAVEQAAPALMEAAGVMLELDQVRAHLLWSLGVGGNRPQLAAGAEIRISGGRHPLLMEALGQGDLAAGAEQVVPLDLEIPSVARALVISGPNAGGKSVALKTVGVFCLLAQCGWDVPGRQDTRLPLVRKLMVDLGDDQSIAEALSSFSAHLGHLAEFLRESGPGTLVLCDEIGSGTDPQEGTALAFAVLEKLVEQGAQVLASTHFGLLKAAVHDHPQMVNAAMDYNEKDLLPLYTFRVGDPGTSHAFDIAGRMGLPDDLLERARGLAGEERVQIEQLLSDLDRRAGDLAEQQRQMELALARHEASQAELEQRLKGLRKERQEVLAATREEGESLLREGRRAIELAVRDIKAGAGGKRVVKGARQRLEEVAETLEQRLAAEDPAVDKRPSAPLAVGMRVRIPHLGLIGRITEVRGNKLTALAEGLRLTLGTEAVVALDEDGQELDTDPTETPISNWNWQADAPVAAHELDLRGETGAEGWERLDRMIDRAIPAGLEVVTVIHGFGTGRLRDFLHRKLERDPRVASFSEAGRGRGGAGATRVVLRG